MLVCEDLAIGASTDSPSVATAECEDDCGLAEESSGVSLMRAEADAGDTSLHAPLQRVTAP